MTDREEALQEVAEARKHLARAEAKLKAEVTYSIGDRFGDENGSKWLMVFDNMGEVHLAELCTGHKHHDTFRVDDDEKITHAEFLNVCDGDTFIRYFNFQTKEVNHDGC